MSFSENLKAARIKMNYSSKDVAKMIGISATTYSNYEIGLREPNFDILRKISTMLQISTDKLLDIDPSARNSFYLNQGLEIMRELGYFKVLNPYDYYDYGEFNLCFVKRKVGFYSDLPSKSEQTQFIAFKESEFIRFMEHADDILPKLPIRNAQKEILSGYIMAFLSYEGPYDDWLDDLERISEKNKEHHPENWELFQERNHLTSIALRQSLEGAKGYLSRVDADLIIKNEADMSYLYNTELLIYADDSPNLYIE